MFLNCLLFIYTVAAATLYVCLNNISIGFDNIPSDMHSLILLILDFDCDSLLLQVSRTYHCRNHILETCLHFGL
jgi:hypothetical protein